MCNIAYRQIDVGCGRVYQDLPRERKPWVLRCSGSQVYNMTKWFAKFVRFLLINTPWVGRRPRDHLANQSYTSFHMLRNLDHVHYIVNSVRSTECRRAQSIMGEGQQPSAPSVRPNRAHWRRPFEPLRGPAR
ncbi:hypothetical protein N7450_011644 [Penicillium hetheringtonii]|uniref:Uncharacterized protein n=1 Tax=Penicillium hetheringtonii TaxID=911720 RepID=A0AAD6DAJ8_9EURO|nr:hypothetical protein N7450_011644 [Penicillium hetheringtonii]